jgi:hypothetical protein
MNSVLKMFHRKGAKDAKDFMIPPGGIGTDGLMCRKAMNGLPSASRRWWSGHGGTPMEIGSSLRS